MATSDNSSSRSSSHSSSNSSSSVSPPLVVEQLNMSEEGREEDTLLSNQTKPSLSWKRITRKIWNLTKANLLLILTVISVILGIAVGAGLSSAHPSQLTQELVSFPGEIFLRALKMLILPLIVFSLLAGLGSLNIKTSGALGLRTILYYGTTTLLAVVLGIILVVSIKPGEGHNGVVICTNNTKENQIDTLDSMLDLVRNLIPDNLFSATFSQTHTEYSQEVDLRKCAVDLGYGNHSNISDLSCGNLTSLLTDDMSSCSSTRIKVLVSREGMNILGIIVFTIAFAIVLSSLGGPEVEQFIRTIGVLNEAIMKLVTLVMWTSPVGIASIIAGKLMEIDSLTELVEQLGLYIVCVLTGLLVHCCIVLPVLYTVLTLSNPLKLVRGCLQALLVAFGTSSSSATLPVTITCLEDNLGYDKRVTRFMLPVGATVNMDGTALYEAVAAVFIAQASSDIQSLGFDKIIIIAITATLASIGAAGVPQAGLVTLVIVLTAIGLPAEDAALILAVDWLLDRIRTVVNVFGDCVGVGIVSRFSKKQLSAPLSPPSPSPPLSKSQDSLSDDTIDIKKGHRSVITKSSTESSRL